MSERLLRGLGLSEQLLLQFAARNEAVPAALCANPPLGGDPREAAEQLQERGLLEDHDVPGVLSLTPMGYALRDTILDGWTAFHARARARLVQHLCAMYRLQPGTPLRVAVEEVDRAEFLAEPTRCLADLDIPLPTGVGRMTTSAPHAILGILDAVQPVEGERVLVCGAKGGVTMGLAARMVGPLGSVLGLDWDGRTVDRVRQVFTRRRPGSAPVRVVGRADVTLGPPDDEEPFHVLIMNGSVPKIPWPLLDALERSTGRILFFLQEPNEPGQTCLVLTASGEIVRDPSLSRFVFTPIHGRYGWDRLDDVSAWLAGEE